MVFLAKDMLLTTKVVIVIIIIVFDLFCYVFLVDYDSVVQFNLSFIFIRPFEKRDVLCRGNVRPSVCPSVRPSVFSGLFFNMLWDINLKLGIYI